MVRSTEPSGFGWKGEDPSFGHSFYKAPIEIAAGDRTCRFRRDDARHDKHIECLDKGGARVWGHDLTASSMADAALASDGAALFVVEFDNTSDGADVTAYELASGELRWSVPVLGLGPVPHSEYLNEVQLGVAGGPVGDTGDSGQVEVLGWESGGRYLERLDKATGERKVTLRMLPEGRTQRLGPEPTKPTPPAPKFGSASNYAWRWDGPANLSDYDRAKVAAPDGSSCSFDAGTRVNALSFECGDGKTRRFGFDLARPASTGGALAADDKQVYLVRYGLNTSGATVTAFDLKTGRRAWDQVLVALGPVSHSKYSNRVQARVERGQLVVFGWEAQGKYVEVLDTRTGKDLGNRVEPGN